MIKQGWHDNMGYNITVVIGSPGVTVLLNLVSRRIGDSIMGTTTFFPLHTPTIAISQKVVWTHTP